MPIFDTKRAKQLADEIEMKQGILINQYNGIPDNSTADKFHQAVSLLRNVSDELSRTINSYDQLQKRLGIK